MRVAVLAGSFIDYSIQMANALNRRGIDVFMVLPRIDLPSHAQGGDLEEGVTVFRYSLPPQYHPSNLLFHRSIMKRVMDYGPDVIHSQGVNPWLDLLLLHMKMKGYPVIVTFHDPKPHTGEDHLRARLSSYVGCKVCDRVLVHGEQLKTVMAEEHQYPLDRIRSIPFGEHQVEPFKRYDREEIVEKKNHVLFFGRISRYKGLQYLIQAEPLITREIPEARIVIAGTGENFEMYERMMVNREHFVVHNYSVPYEEGAVLFKQCSVVVLPYTDASQSGVVPTAYGFHKPVVVTDVGAIPEIVEGGKTGFIVPPEDPEALAEAVVTLLRDDPLRRSMGDAGYAMLKTTLSWERIAEQLEAVYQALI